jgi:hypothetical protein
LSRDPKIQLLERNDIEKVYREQGMSAANQDYLKLGRILGADGLLLLEVVRTKSATNLMTRLVAVKPGVVVTASSFPWPLQEMPAWAGPAAARLAPFLPKLTVLSKEAIPLSVVNLRSAVQSARAQDLEQELKLLAVQRLSQERRLFVLERQRMERLGEEKQLNADESAFWSGSYLLEGVVDPNGQAADTITIDARLVPPKGGAPLLFQVSGSRTNHTEVVGRLAARVSELLQVNSTLTDWKAADEAAQYLTEARWALRWGAYAEAQAAAESAWALGHKDLGTALVRVQVYVNEIPELAMPGFSSYSRFGKKDARYVPIDEPPNPRYPAVALRALQYYEEFCRNSPGAGPQVGSTNREVADWSRLGMDGLAAAARVLQHFHFTPAARRPMAENLPELRARARSVADLISRSPAVHDSYFVGDRIAIHDELAHTVGEGHNIFDCQVNWGCFWQERPEDALALYRELMSSAVFCYVHRGLWFREPGQPRLVAWNPEDERRLPALWNNFVRELNESTNVLLRLEGRALRLADAPDEPRVGAAFTNLFECLFENREFLVAHNVDLFYLGWGTGRLVEAKIGTGLVTTSRESLNRAFYADYSPRLAALEQEYWNKTVPAGNLRAVFPRQEAYLRESRPYDFFEFDNLFRTRNYSPAQAREILLLLAAYKSNLVARSGAATGLEQGKLMGGVAQVGFLESDVNRVLNPVAPAPPRPVPVTVSQPTPPVGPAPVASAPAAPPLRVTNAILVRDFLPVPLDGLAGDDISRAQINAHHWLEDRLLVDFHYTAAFPWLNDQGGVQGTRTVTVPAIGLLDPRTRHWEVIAGPEVKTGEGNIFYHRTTLVKGTVYTCVAGQILQYDRASRQWTALAVSAGENYQLFGIAGRLYAANGTTIFEITEGGKATRVLASTRRNPALSVMDKLGDLGEPLLFEGADHVLQACVQNHLYAWVKEDWQEQATAPSTRRSAVFEDGVLFRHGAGNGQPGGLSRLVKGGAAPELCVRSAERLPGPAYAVVPQPATNTPMLALPRWKMPVGFSVAGSAAALRQANLYLLVDHSGVRRIRNERQVIVREEAVETNGCHAELLCFSSDLQTPQRLFLKFDAPDACPPVAGTDPGPVRTVRAAPAGWMLLTHDLLLLGQESLGLDLVGYTGRTPWLGCPAGVWMIPLAELEPTFAAQRQRLAPVEARERGEAAAAAGQRHRDLLAKYDRNHDGVIAAEEREEALDDPAFIASELDAIDASHNGRLDPEELAWFDANRNQTLDAKEQAGIELAQHLLAANLLKEFDADGDGLLNAAESAQLLSSWPDPGWRRYRRVSLPDASHAGYADLQKLEAYLKEETSQALLPSGALPPMGGRLVSVAGVAAQTFKTTVEFYWHHPQGLTNIPPPGPGRPPDWRDPTNGIPATPAP